MAAKLRFMAKMFVLWLAMSVAAAPPATSQLTDRDFQQLLQAAVTISGRASQVQPTTSRICVQRELEPPLEFSKQLGPSHLPVGIADADRALNAAMSAPAPVARHASMPPLPSRFILFSKEKRPAQCAVQSIALPGQRVDESTVVLSFTEPALANGYAFIEEYENCPGLCGTTFLRTFRKQHGKWVQVARTVLAVS